MQRSQVLVTHGGVGVEVAMEDPMVIPPQVGGAEGPPRARDDVVHAYHEESAFRHAEHDYGILRVNVVHDGVEHLPHLDEAEQPQGPDNAKDAQRLPHAGQGRRPALVGEPGDPIRKDDEDVKGQPRARVVYENPGHAVLLRAVDVKRREEGDYHVRLPKGQREPEHDLKHQVVRRLERQLQGDRHQVVKNQGQSAQVPHESLARGGVDDVPRWLLPYRGAARLLLFDEFDEVLGPVVMLPRARRHVPLHDQFRPLRIETRVELHVQVVPDLVANFR
mmetsp:Transcript_71812/g.219858  ORF Transcript_71812/g.219858 Transcript_71812/m.219858 type:complete len:277 (-) Transcript_71812:110-940(-)